MSNELSTLNDIELNNVLRNSLFPGASDMSLSLVKGYCKASGLDIMLKPAHIVPIWNSAIGKMVDVVMPGIGLYRTIASRTGQYAGITEPEYGETVTKVIGGVEVTYPEWCKVTVKRNMGGVIAEFTAKEYWTENYAIKGGKERSVAPNAMWFKRPFAQLAKCSESQALRKAFPEVGSQPTAEEMEGKSINDAIEKSVSPSTPAPIQTLEEILARINTSATDVFDWIDAMQFTKEEKGIIRAATTKRRQELKDATIVADIPKSNGPNWLQMMTDAASQEELSAIFNSVPEAERGAYNEQYELLLDAFMAPTA